MERKLGEIFTYEGKTYQVIENTLCKNCAFTGKKCGSLLLVTGECSTKRSDKTSVAFKEINNMEIKNDQLIIKIPEGMEIDLENSNLAKGIIKFKTKSITYNDAYNELNDTNITINTYFGNEIKLKALVKLMNIAKYYNKDWDHNASDDNSIGYAIYYGAHLDNGGYLYNTINPQSSVYYGVPVFKNKEDAQAVIDNPNFRDILDKIYKN